MVTEAPPTRVALRREVARVTALLRSIDEPHRAPVVGQWDLTEVAVHLSQVWLGLPGLARRDLSALDHLVPDRAAGGALVADVRQLAEFTARGVRADPERDLAVLADRIDTRAADYLADTDAGAGADLGRRPWVVPEVTVAPSVLAAHLLSETVVHGWDIARAAGRPWRIDRAHAALVIGEFLLPVLVAGGPRLLAGAARAERASGRYLLGLRGGGRFRLLLDGDGMRLSDPGAGPVDCRMWVDPAAFLLLVFGRLGQWSALARGQLLVYGRRPWLASRLHAALPRV